MAWNILSAAHKVLPLYVVIPSDLILFQTIITQMDRDDCIVHLLEVMDDVYFFVHEAEPVKKIESHGRIVTLMAQQTTECAYFIRDYAMDKNFCMSTSVCVSCGRISPLSLLPGKRALKNSFMSTVDSKIKQYEDKFKELKLAFQDHAILQTGITVSRIMGDLESLGEFSAYYLTSCSL
jgi:hypothetical protein